MLAAFITLFAIIIISLIITRIATIALTLTGISREVARFQARSALTGAGFTTSESEKMMNHPVRRRILMLLMLVGNAGIVTVIASAILVVANAGSDSLAIQGLVIVVGLAFLLALTKSKWVDKKVTRLITVALRKWTDLETSDAASLIYLGGDYQISELEISFEDWLAEMTLQKSRLADEGLLVLGIQKPGGEYIGAPVASTKLIARDVLLLYGRGGAIQDLDRRRRGLRGEVAHAEAIAEQKRVLEKQEANQDKNNTQVPEGDG